MYANLLLAAALVFTTSCRPATSLPASDSTHRATDSAAGAIAPTSGKRPASLAPGQAAAPTDSALVIADQARTRGASSAPLWMIIISDFQCPYCKQWHDETWPSIDHDYVATGKLRVAYVNFPLSIHPFAKPAAEAAMCAAVQDKFWPVQDALFKSQDEWVASGNPRPKFEAIATAAGVDVTKWKACMDSHRTMPLIEADYDKAASAGVQSTPSFFIGNEALAGAAPYAQFKTIIDRQLARVSAPAKH